jgi:hypothetical protein
VAHAPLVVRRHPGHCHQPAGDHLRHCVGRYRSPTPGRSASGPGPTDVALPQRPRRRQRRALHLAGRHGHNNRADLAAPDRDRRVLGHPVPRCVTRGCTGACTISETSPWAPSRLGLCRARRRLPGPAAQRDHRDRWSARRWRQTWPKRMTLKTSTGQGMGRRYLGQARRAFAGGRDRGQAHSRGGSPDSSGFRRSITVAPIFANRTGSQFKLSSRAAANGT